MESLHNLDTGTFFLLNNLAGVSPSVDILIRFFADYLAYILIAVLAILLFRTAYPLKEKMCIFIMAVGSGLIARFGVAELIRFLYHRPRPFFVYDVHQLIPETSYSFPSGHAAFFFAFSTAVYLYNKTWGIGFFVASALIGVARVAAGVHYPSDIIGGMLVGIVVAELSMRYLKPWCEQIIARFI